MTREELCQRGSVVRGQLDQMTLNDLLALNPTLPELWHVFEVMVVSSGKCASEWHIEEVQRLLNRGKNDHLEQRNLF